MSTEDSFIKVSPPNGAVYELSVAAGDIYHDSVRSGGANDENWHFLNVGLRPGDVFFDLGANIGTISIPAAVIGAEVHAFELLEENARHLENSAQRNGLAISVFVGAISDTDGFAGVAGHSAWAAVVPTSKVQVRSLTIDSYITAHAIGRVTAMKIDIEGSELAALRGATSLIKRDHPDIVIESNAFTCGSHNYSYREMLRLLKVYGYSLYRLCPGRLCPWAVDMVQEIIYTDYFATMKLAAEITAKSCWPISPLTQEEVIANIVKQDLHGALHQQFVLAIRHALPASVLDDLRVAPLIARWADCESIRKAPTSIAILQIGSA